MKKLVLLLVTCVLLNGCGRDVYSEADNLTAVYGGEYDSEFLGFKATDCSRTYSKRLERVCEELIRTLPRDSFRTDSIVITEYLSVICLNCDDYTLITKDNEYGIITKPELKLEKIEMKPSGDRLFEEFQRQLHNALYKWDLGLLGFLFSNSSHGATDVGDYVATLFILKDGKIVERRTVRFGYTHGWGFYRYRSKSQQDSIMAELRQFLDSRRPIPMFAPNKQ